MFKHTILAATTAAAIGLGSLATVNEAHADGILNFMNPFEWFDDDDDDDYRYRYNRWGYGPYGYHRGPWGRYPGHPGQGQRIVIVMPEQQQNTQNPEPYLPQ